MSVCCFLLHTAGIVAIKIRENRKAGIALIVAISLPFLIGAAGFATDAAFWFAQHAALQSAADAGALAAARALETTPGTAQTVLASDALAAANAASNNQFNLAAASLSVSLMPGDARQVEVDASTPAKLFFSPAAHIGAFNIHTRAVAGVTYSRVSTQAVCQALDSFTYIFSTGFGTLETAHSSGIDPYTCGQSALVPPQSAFCNSGVLNCVLDPVTNLLKVNVGGSLVPIVFQVEPSGYSTPLGLPLTSVLATIPSLLGGMTSTSTGVPTVYQQGSSNCPGNVCTIAAGVYPGGIIIGPGVTFNFATNGSGLGNNYFLLLNGNLVISTQATLGSGSNNFVFLMLGATPGAYVSETQVQLNLAPISQGALTYTSTANFNYSSVLGMQISSPVSSMSFAEQQATSTTPGLLTLVGLPGGNLVGSNYETLVSACPQATSLCVIPVSVGGPQYETALLPSVDSVTSLLPVQSLVSALGSTPLASVAKNLLISSGESSSTVFTSNIAIANGTPTDWSQTETQAATLSNSSPTLTSVLGGVGSLIGSILNILFPSPVTTNVTAVYNYLTQGSTPLSNPDSASANGVFAGETSTSAGAPGCSAGAQNLYAGAASITPAFGPVFNNLQSSSATPNDQTVALTTTDTIKICGTESQSLTLA
jgi:Flp pilus assembly protein TadG